MQVLRSRITSHGFTIGEGLSEEEIRGLIQTVSATPSSFNIQHWRFIAVTTEANKRELRPVAFDQAQVTESAVTFIVMADTDGHERLADILSRSVSQGIMATKVASQWVSIAAKRYKDPAERRDEAIRSGSMAAMALMTAVADKGWVSCPMIGFDPLGLKSAFAFLKITSL